jgi:hypothetical protein
MAKIDELKPLAVGLARELDQDALRKLDTQAVVKEVQVPPAKM